MFIETVTNMLGSAFVMKHSAILQAISDTFYYATTTLIGNQTIGEEYSDVVLDHDGQYPSFFRRLMMVALCVGSPFALKAAFKRFTRMANANKDTLDLIAKTKQFIAGPVLSLHLAFFYIFGSFYELSKRVLGIKYKLLRKLRNGESHGGYEILGLLIVIRLILTGMNRKQARFKGKGVFKEMHAVLGKSKEQYINELRPCVLLEMYCRLDKDKTGMSALQTISLS
ncbi:peroxisome biogenesis factor 10 [Terramyces sp. JEL0728]|nr:peroxisome biogenesis factor 10 [Terramyces sp. JEL0728]